MKPSTRRERRQKIEELLKARPTLSDREVARQLNTTHPTVRKVRIELGLHSPTQKRMGKDGVERRPPEDGADHKEEMTLRLHRELWQFAQPNSSFEVILSGIGDHPISRADYEQSKEVLKFLKERIEGALSRLEQIKIIR